MTPLTAIQLRVLQFVRDFQQRSGSMPTRAEISREFGWKAANAADCHIQTLKKKGFVQTVPGTSRGLRFTEAGLRLLALPSTMPAAATRDILALPVVSMAKVNQLARQGRAVS